MKYCKDCGAKNKNGAQECAECGCPDFRYKCANCGTRFENLPRCPECGVKAGRSARTCPECGERYFTKVCPECGYEQTKETRPAVRGGQSVSKGGYTPHSDTGGLTCKRCGSHNVNVQIAATKETHSRRGCLWSLGRMLLIVFTLGLWLIIGKSAGKTKVQNNSFAVCQSCGNRWQIR